KEILTKILERKYEVLSTPENINTLIGIARLILEKLKLSHQVFVAEIGAYRRGDTRQVSELIKPQIGILTGLNEQHLERFGSMENIVATESELLEELPKGGTAILNRDDKYYVESARHLAKGAKLITFSLETKRAGSFEIESLEITESGSKFTLKDQSGTNYNFSTKLLGKHNIANIMMAILAACALGIDLKEISEAVLTIEPPEHRLKPIVRENDIIILDDSYNINPDGARVALEVLSLFKERRKIVMTHGLVELGKLEEKINREFGESLAKVADLVIAAGPKANLIFDGLKASNFPVTQVIIAADYKDAQKKLWQIARPKDVILIQTDLPDSYY
ncbi:MAG: Mur ligase family protein, partial [Candidatus Paceibacteria bacterium]